MTTTRNRSSAGKGKPPRRSPKTPAAGKAAPGPARGAEAPPASAPAKKTSKSTKTDKSDKKAKSPKRAAVRPPKQPPDAAPGPGPQERFLNREWSWLRFNERVLEEAEDEANPLLERGKFLAIFASNLDEFFMVRVGGLYRQLDAGILNSGTDRRSPREQLDGISRIVHRLLPRLERAQQALMARLAEEGVGLLRYEQLDREQQAYLDRYYDEVLYPVITPMIVGPTHPFPALQSGTLYLALRLSQKRKKGGQRRFIAFVGLPRVLPRFVPLRQGAAGRMDLVPLESILAARMPALFSGYAIRAVTTLRVTRDADILIDEEAAEDFRKAVAGMLLGRRKGAAVRLEYGPGMEGKLLDELQERLEVDPLQHYAHEGMMQQADLFQVPGLVNRPDLMYPVHRPLQLPGGTGGDIFAWLRQEPRLLYHPYHAFDPVAELVRQAADDPAVLAIKQTLYRTSGDSPVVRALTRAAELGKHVTAVVELRARFDEERNIEWARRLEKAGVHVVYGLVGFKTHCKVLLVVRREESGIRRYVHMGTGNYNDATARLYTDMGLMASDELLGADASALFNMMTGATQAPPWNKVITSPEGLRRRLVHFIEREVARSARRSRGRILAKMNSLVDGEIIDALYAASQAGVQVDLIVRGICCLRAGVPELSDNIRVVSVVGRFLEHARVFYFKNGGKPEIYISSADWMPRNLDHRVELTIPLEDPRHREYVMQVLELQIGDNVKARVLGPDGRYTRRAAGKKPVDSQADVYKLTRGWSNREAAAAPGRNARRVMR